MHIGFTKSSKVKIAIEHAFAPNPKSYIRKARRKIGNTPMIQKKVTNIHSERNIRYNSWGIVKSALATITVLPLVFVSL